MKANKKTPRPLSQAQRDNLEIAEMERADTRNLPPSHWRLLRSLKRRMRELERLRVVYHRMKQGKLTATDRRWLLPVLPIRRAAQKGGRL